MQFLPENVEYLACKELKKLRHDGSIRDHVRKFITLMLDIVTMIEEDPLFHFMDGLQSWAERELQRRKVQYLASVIAIAKKLPKRTRKIDS